MLKEYVVMQCVSVIVIQFDVHPHIYTFTNCIYTHPHRYSKLLQNTALTFVTHSLGTSFWVFFMATRVFYKLWQ